MSNNRANRREIIPLDEVPRSSTPEPAPKRPRDKEIIRASRDLSDRAATDLALERDASLDQDPQATIADPEQGQMLRLDQDPQATNASPEQERNTSSDQDPQTTIESPVQGRMLRLDQDPQATNASAEQDRIHPLDPA